MLQDLSQGILKLTENLQIHVLLSLPWLPHLLKLNNGPYLTYWRLGE